jgi:succinate dehydrogenase / fumarate reductase flavoprotein subunit
VEANTGRHLISALDALVRTQEEVPALDDFGAPVPGERLVKRTDYWRFVSVVKDDHGTTVGVVAQDIRSLAFKAFTADGVVLATGDYAGLFAQAPVNGSVTGAALGAVYRQGAVLSNLESLQMHPLVMVRGAASVALPEMLRAYGARLGSRGKDQKTPQELDLSTLDAELRARFISSLGPSMMRLLSVDLSREGVSVEPRVLRGLGGLWVDCDPESTGLGFSARQHATTLPGLYAAGGADAQYHGAASLPGNLAPADLLGGQLAARGVVCFRESLAKSAFDLPKSVFEKQTALAESEFEALFGRESKNGDSPQRVLDELRKALARSLGTNRSGEGLEALAERVNRLAEQAERVSISGPRGGWNQDALLAASLKDIFALAQAIVSSALWRDALGRAEARTDNGKNKAGRGKASWVRAGSDRDPETLETFEYECAGQTLGVAR